MNENKGNNQTEGLKEDHFDYRLLVQNMKDYAICMLDPEGRIVSWTEGAQRMKGYAPDEVIGKNTEIFYTKEDIAEGKPRRKLEVAAKTGRYEEEGWRQRKDGSRFWANVVVNSILDKDGSLIGFAQVTRDITERRRHEEALARQAREILEISTPVVQVWDGILLVPLIGTLDSQRTQQVMEKLLTAIADTNSPVALLDITGVPTIDTQTARHLVETVTAVRLLGAEVLLTGVRPAIAQTLVHLGIELSGVITRSSLASGLKQALEMLAQERGSQNGAASRALMTHV
ncbi:MAG TPA: PAS domain S-box protein [Pyrinomonadaceae bacterium]|nr:PAS domain S-box protein [Pyrinomonadaceae bacterium]